MTWQSISHLCQLLSIGSGDDAAIGTLLRRRGGRRGWRWGRRRCGWRRLHPSHPSSLGNVWLMAANAVLMAGDILRAACCESNGS